MQGTHTVIGVQSTGDGHQGTAAPTFNVPDAGPAGNWIQNIVNAFKDPGTCYSE
jgi:hypothetical protein